MSPGFTLPKPTVSPETWPFMRMKGVISAETPSFEGLGLSGVRNPCFAGLTAREKGGAVRRLPRSANSAPQHQKDPVTFRDRVFTLVRPKGFEPLTF